MCDTREFCRGRFQRYKGIELFFKRLAFNLGNSPSQTEVKIISCVPIDVTEMQARINSLQKEVDEMYKREGNANIQTALHVPTFNPPNYNNMDRNVNIQQVRPSPHYPNFGSFEDNNVASFNINNNNNMDREPATNTTYPNDNLTDTHSDIDTTAAIRNSSVTSLEYCEGTESPKQNPIKNIFRKSKKPKRYKNDAIVYHAKTINTPLMLQAKKRARKNIPKREEFFNRSYVRGLMRQQESAAEDTHSIQSTPVCRDVSETACHVPRRYESDACSSCHVKFQDIDNYAPKLQHNRHFYTTNDTTSHSYYDDQLYDMVPVKDESKPKKANMEVPAQYSLDQGHLKIGSPWVKRKPHPANNLKIVHHKYPRYKRDQLMNKMFAKPSFCMVEYGDVYTKNANSDANIYKIAKNKAPVRTKSVVLKINEGTNTVCEIATETELTPEQPVEPKTEETLDQIKTILRSVLSEVKTSTLKQRNLNVKTDAVVQKDASQMDMYKRSRLLQSYTYSPYEINPYAPCHRQMGISSPTPNPPLPYSYPYQGRCQTFPLIVQQSPILSKPFCASCSRQNPSFTKPYPIHTHPNSIPTLSNPIPTFPNTNLANAKSSSRPNTKLNSETEQLIKEIYNSLNHEIIPSKEPEKVPSKNVSKKSVKTDNNLRRNVTLTTIKSASPFETMTNTSSSALDSSRAISSSRDRDSYQTEVESRHVVERRHNIGSENKRVQSQSEVAMPQRSDIQEHVFEHAACPHHHHHHDVIEESEELLLEEPETDDDESIYLYNTEDSDDGESQVSKSEKPKGLFSKIGSVFKKKSAHGSKQFISNETYRETEILTDADDDQYPHGSRRPEGITFRKPGKQMRIGATMSTNKEALLDKEYRQYKDELRMAKNLAMKNLPERHPGNYYHKNYLVQNAVVDYEDPPRHRDELHSYPHPEPLTNTTGQNYDTNIQDNRKINYIKVTSKATDTKPKKTALSWLKQVKPKCGPEWKKMIREL